MSNDRQRLEQEALQALNRGNSEGALKAYLGILRMEPKDRRIRQKVGEIYLKQGKPQDAERHLREVAEALVKEGSHRAAVAVLKQLAAIKPDDPDLQMDLAEGYLASAYQSDARACFDRALRTWLALNKPLLAAKAAARLAEVTPTDVTLRLRVAELLVQGGDAKGAGAAYQEVIDEFRRRGRVDEVGRIAELALAVRPDDVGLLLDASQSRIALGEFKKALQALQTAFVAAPKEPRTLDLLARAFEGAGQPDRALKVLSELSRVAADRGDLNAEVDALRRAVALAPGDADVVGRLSAAEDRLSRFERRLTGLAFCAPANEDMLRVCVRAEVYARYGRYERAENELRAAMTASPDSTALLAAFAELLVTQRRLVDAVPWVERLVPRAGAESAAVLDRLALLRGVAAPAAPSAPEPEEARAPSAPATPTGPETPEARGDRLSAKGDLAGALLAWREALSDDPLNEGVLAKIAALRTAARAAPPPPAPEPTFGRPDEGTFAEIEPEAIDEIEPMGDEALESARVLVSVGQFADALALLSGRSELEARVIEAQAYKSQGDLSRAVDVLREATNDAAEDDPAYPEALFDLAALYTSTAKQRSALRLLEEVRDLAPDFRPTEVATKIRGLQMVVK